MKKKLKVSWRKRRAFLKKKISERNCLWVFFCYMCCHTIADPDGILYRAGNCVRCGSGHCAGAGIQRGCFPACSDENGTSLSV